MRHSAVTNVYRTSRDLFLAQRFARHASPLTSVLHTHPRDQRVADKFIIKLVGSDKRVDR